MFSIKDYQEEINRRRMLKKDYLGKPLVKNNCFDFTNQGDEIQENPIVLFIGPTTRAVRRTFADAGFITTDSETKFNVMWGTPQSLEWIGRLVPGQVCAHIAGQYCIVRKDSLAETLSRASFFNKEFELLEIFLG
uniref:Tubulin tyrosine ligase n=1 Tax=Trepomonas sp. PC1 TaxID=1076344 RepID=A0A146KE43_9EUKA|eukprot:JAP94478.1 Tubulin tyrosine ligase [Trepomonas sp. PC1]